MSLQIGFTYAILFYFNSASVPYAYFMCSALECSFSWVFFSYHLQSIMSAYIRTCVSLQRYYRQKQRDSPGRYSYNVQESLHPCVVLPAVIRYHKRPMQLVPYWLFWGLLSFLTFGSTSVHITEPLMVFSTF